MSEVQGFTKKQEKAFLNLINYLSCNNKYYKEVFQKSKVDLTKDNAFTIYNKLPYLRKEDIQKNYEKYLSSTDERVYEELTSGTSGIMLKCVKSASERTNAALNIWNVRGSIDREVNYSNFIDIFSDEVEEKIGKFYNLQIPKLIEHFEKIMSLHPRWLAGPISLIERFALLINNGLIKYKNNGELKYIEFAGEYVDNKKREFIESVFDCKTLNNYGTRETWCIAYECTQKKLHVQEKLIYLDVYEREIVLTSLYNKVMPIVKYRLGDLGELEFELCSCGNISTIVELNRGRISNIITGSEILGDYFFDQIIWNLLLKYENCIEGFYVEQIKLKEFDFYITKGQNFHQDIPDIIKKNMLEEIGQEVIVNFIYIDNISRLKSGKTKKFKALV